MDSRAPFIQKSPQSSSLTGCSTPQSALDWWRTTPPVRLSLFLPPNRADPGSLFLLLSSPQTQPKDLMNKHLSAPTLTEEASQSLIAAEEVVGYQLGETLGVGAYAV